MDYYFPTEFLNQNTIHPLPHFEGEPFKSCLTTEDLSIYVHDNWRFGLGGKALNTRLESSTFGEHFGLIESDSNELTQTGKKVMQWSSFFMNGTSLKALKPFDEFLKNEISSDLGFDREDQTRFFREFRNLGFLKSLRSQEPITPKDWEIIESEDLQQKPLAKAFEVVESQPGYWGPTRLKKKTAYYNNLYGDTNNWQTLFSLADKKLITSQTVEVNIFKAKIKFFVILN
jgi:hypothetical protein